MSASASTSTPAPAPRRARTRTGCKTCRQRKLKCDEVKPICGHCRKSNRECQPSEGIAFRHAQNAGFNDQEGGNELGNFYKYRQKFENTFFLPIPQELSFVHVTDPYADEPVTTSTATTSSQAQQAMPPPQLQHHQHQLQHQHQHSQQAQHPHHTQYHPPSQPPPPPYQHPQYVDVAATSLKAMIDPNLESGTANNGELGNGGQESMTAVEMTEAETLNETILNALKQSDAEMGIRGGTVGGH